MPVTDDPRPPLWPLWLQTVESLSVPAWLGPCGALPVCFEFGLIFFFFIAI